MIFWNRKNIEIANKIMNHHGRSRCSQTNSKMNANFGLIRIYQKKSDKGKPERAIIVIETLEQLVNNS